ncbi:MAG: ribonuclease P protein component [Phycisphaerales bacterium]|nr:MAG: ribonuclease P protein component [Phycisphaerales bacterium]
MPDRPASRAQVRYRFPRRMRLMHARQFRAVYAGQVRRNAGPLLVYAAPNGLDHLRIGLAVPKRVGTAVRRNRVKRMLREALRLMQHDLPGGYDLVVNVRPHERLTLEEYTEALAGAIRALHQTWQKRQDKRQNAQTEGNAKHLRG